MNKNDFILIVDDDPNLRKSLSDILKSKGYAPEAVPGGKEALERIKEKKPAVALIDIRMVDMSGMDLMEEMRHQSPETACIVLTGYASRETAIEAVNLGAYSYIEKPYDVDQLLLTLRRAIEKQQAEEALRESEERFRSVAQLAVDAIVIANSEGKIIFWNEAAQSIFGYSEDEIIGKPVTFLFPERFVAGHQAEMEQMRSADKDQVVGDIIEFQGLRKNGREFPLELSLASWMSGAERFFSVIVRDVTDIQEAQRRVQLQDRLAAVGQMAAGIAHDFNNILGSVILYSQLLEKELGLSVEGRDKLRVIIQQADRASGLIAQILDFSRRSMMEPRPMRLVPFLKEMKKLLTHTLPENIRIKLDFKDEKYIVNADPTRLQQVILNLSLNAKDAMPEGGELRLSLSKVSIAPDQQPPLRDIAPGEWVKLEVMDTGVGITPEVMKHIFEPFFTTKEPGSGTGLGLAQVYGIVKQHGGHIDVESEVGAWTRFTIYFPLEKITAEDDTLIGIARVPRGQKETILVVEDDLAMRRAVTDILESLGYKVLVAADGREAILILDQHAKSIDLLLTDLVLPDMSGRMLCEMLTGKRSGIIPILMTGYPLGEGTRELRDKGGVTWLQKPLTWETLARTVRIALAWS